MRMWKGNGPMGEMFSMPAPANAWIMVIPVWAAGFIAAKASPCGTKRAADMSWYRPIDGFASFGSMFFMIAFMVLSLFVRIDFALLRSGVGLAFVCAGAAAHVWAKISYGAAAQGRVVAKGIYRYSRNPMYVSMSVVLLGTAVAAGSRALAALWLVSAILAHILIRGEERYCLATYREEYRSYMRKVPRYAFFI